MVRLISKQQLVLCCKPRNGGVDMSSTIDLSNYYDTQQAYLTPTLPRDRMTALFDEGTFVEIGSHILCNKEEIQLVAGYGEINGNLVYAFAQGGAITVEHTVKLKKLYDLALKSGTLVVGMYDSHGVDLSQGLDVINAVGEIISLQAQISGMLPQISLVLGPCIGVNATMASLGDYLLMSESGSFFAAPPSINVEETVATAKTVGEAGIAHQVYENNEDTIFATRNLVDIIFDNVVIEHDSEVAEEDSINIIDTIAENINNYLPEEYLKHIFDKDSLFELMPDFGKNVYAAFAQLENRTTGIIATKGDALSSDDCVKIARLVSVWDSFNIPVVTFVNNESLSFSEVSAARDIAKISHVYAQATTSKIAVITGKAYGAGFVALASRAANSDYTVAWPKAIITPLAPNTSVAFLQAGMITADKSREELEAEYIKTKASASYAAEIGAIDDIVSPSSTRDFLNRAFGTMEHKFTAEYPKKHSNIPF